MLTSIHHSINISSQTQPISPAHIISQEASHRRELKRSKKRASKKTPTKWTLKSIRKRFLLHSHLRNEYFTRRRRISPKGLSHLAPNKSHEEKYG